MDEREKQAIEERQKQLDKTVKFSDVFKPEEETQIVSNVIGVSPKLIPLTKLNIIESNRQIVRNESGQTKHKEFTGDYEAPTVRAPHAAPDFPTMIGRNIPITKEAKLPGKDRSVIGWVVLLVIVAVAVIELYVLL